MSSLSRFYLLRLVQQVASLPVGGINADVPLHVVVSTDQRSIFNIVWSCVATLFACTWVAVHPDLPGLDTGRTSHFFHRFKLMLWVLISPEAVLIWAWRQNRGAQALKTLMNADELSHDWTMTHSHFLQMGGFALHDAEDNPKGLLNYHQFKKLLDQKRIKYPSATADHIQDRSKSDGLSKFIAVGQALWFIVQCIARTAAGLPITLIELATAAFAPLSVIMYILWWDKPQNVQSYVAVRLLKNDSDVLLVSPMTQDYNGQEPASSAKEAIDDTPVVESLPKVPETPPFNAKDDNSKFPWYLGAIVVTSFENMLGTTRRSQSMEDGANRVPRFYAFPANSHPDKIPRTPVILGSILGAMFGTVHCLGWTFSFPSSVEKTVWRVTSASIVAIPPLAIGLIFTTRKYFHRDDKTASIVLEAIFALMAVILAISYIISRFAILVVMFTVLRALQQDQLKDIQWVANIPHI